MRSVVFFNQNGLRETQNGKARNFDNSAEILSRSG